MSEATPVELTRRGLIRCSALCGAAGAAVPLLAACGSDTKTASTAADSPGAAKRSRASTAPSPKGGDSGGAADGLVAAADVPVGGGVILEGPKVVVTQPAKGDLKAFTAVCTHQGCTVGSVENGVIKCFCHGSQFSAEDGSVVQGPANAPLKAVQVTVKRGQVVQA